MNSKILFIFTIVIFPFIVFAQSDEEETVEADTSTPTTQFSAADEELLNLGMKNFDDRNRDGRGIRACFYNVENLFDTYDDSLTVDEEFLPKGVKGWTYSRYSQKLSNIYKTMAAVGAWGGPPEIIGFCEIENKKVLSDLVRKTPFLKYDYRIVHEDSPDARGIDVGFIYRPSSFQYITHKALRLTFDFDTAAKTRDILYICGTVENKDTLHIFINHWPSRRGGQAASEPRRIAAAKLVRSKIDSILQVSPDANIILMGDFNDHAEDKSLHQVLRAKHHKEELKQQDLFNYMYELGKNWKMGSHKYQGHWGTLDHVIVSAALTQKRENKLFASEKGANIFAGRFLLEQDKKFLGLQPYRTYAGPRFIGGFSDHLPVYIDLLYKD
jgi:predicted extracellular nuclease